MYKTLIKALGLGTLVALAATQIAGASSFTYRPINPSFGGDPLNGNWLLAYGQSQIAGSSETPDFSIDFPDLGTPLEPEVPVEDETLTVPEEL
jgi:curli production assembly/transport component CsgF